MGHSPHWPKAIHKIIGEIRDKFPSLSWMRISISYRRFRNVRELLQGDLTTKLNERLYTKDLEDLICNCKTRKTSGCPYLGRCREKVLIYQVNCLTTGKAYIGCTQQTVKKRTQQHIGDVKRLVRDEVASDSFAAHFAQLVPKNTPRPDIKNFIKVKVDIIWKGNALATAKTFGTRGCKLCAKERLAILKLLHKNPSKAINTNNEIYGACRHRPKFHRLNLTTASTDESEWDEKVPPPLLTMSSIESTETEYSALSANDDNTPKINEAHPPHHFSFDIEKQKPLGSYMTRRPRGLHARAFYFTEEYCQEVSAHVDDDGSTDLDLVETQTDVDTGGVQAHF